MQPLPGSFTTLAFDPSGEFRGTAGCNSYRGTYTVEGELISIKSLNVTEISCGEPPGVAAQEEYYLSLLENTTRYHVEDEHMVLSYYDIERLMVLQIKE